MQHTMALHAGLTRRGFLQFAAAASTAAVLPLADAVVGPRTLRARASRVPLVGAPHPASDVWTYDGDVPGPELRFRQGDRLRILVENRLPDATTVHWHGVRLPNAMDGVPNVTQPPIKPDGDTFLYDFVLKDAGTYWYHPHLGSPEQVARGLYGALVVEEEKAPFVDRDVAWVLGDWRLDREARIVADFRNFMDASHGGRIGNTVTINGRVQEAFELRAGERVRLRLVNAANARIFALDFRGHSPVVIALDGHPVEPHRPEGGRIVLGPGMRADVLLDAAGEPGSVHKVVDDFYPRQAYQLLDLRYAAKRDRGRAGDPMPKLAPNPLSAPDVTRAKRHELRFEGGMMGRMPPAPARGDERAIWSIDGKSATEGHHHHEPLLQLEHGRSYVLQLTNDTAWPHPIHLHGHVFRVLSRNGQPSPRVEWADTVLLSPRSNAEVAFVADNPGDWMLHCHVLEHQATGMMALVRVS